MKVISIIEEEGLESLKVEREVIKITLKRKGDQVNYATIFASRNPHTTSFDRVLLDIQVKALLYSHPEKGVLVNQSISDSLNNSEWNMGKVNQEKYQES